MHFELSLALPSSSVLDNDFYAEGGAAAASSSNVSRRRGPVSSEAINDHKYLVDELLVVEDVQVADEEPLPTIEIDTGKGVEGPPRPPAQPSVGPRSPGTTTSSNSRNIEIQALVTRNHQPWMVLLDLLEKNLDFYTDYDASQRSVLIQDEKHIVCGSNVIKTELSVNMEKICKKFRFLKDEEARAVEARYEAGLNTGEQYGLENNRNHGHDSQFWGGRFFESRMTYQLDHLPGFSSGANNDSGNDDDNGIFELEQEERESERHAAAQLTLKEQLKKFVERRQLVKKATSCTPAQQEHGSSAEHQHQQQIPSRPNTALHTDKHLGYFLDLLEDLMSQKYDGMQDFGMQQVMSKLKLEEELDLQTSRSSVQAGQRPFVPRSKHYTVLRIRLNSVVSPNLSKLVSTTPSPPAVEVAAAAHQAGPTATPPKAAPTSQQDNAKPYLDHFEYLTAETPQKPDPRFHHANRFFELRNDREGSFTSPPGYVFRRRGIFVDVGERNQLEFELRITHNAYSNVVLPFLESRDSARAAENFMKLVQQMKMPVNLELIVHLSRKEKTDGSGSAAATQTILADEQPADQLHDVETVEREPDVGVYFEQSVNMHRVNSSGGPLQSAVIVTDGI
ncbi:unnamed protein product [Amoebophrya sp. A120]|nr:unnamed protein product [Amoebophrya sp. A120]|eukprot:GSA120T00014479001.1